MGSAAAYVVCAVWRWRLVGQTGLPMEGCRWGVVVRVEGAACPTTTDVHGGIGRNGGPPTHNFPCCQRPPIVIARREANRVLTSQNMQGREPVHLMSVSPPLVTAIAVLATVATPRISHSGFAVTVATVVAATSMATLLVGGAYAIARRLPPALSAWAGAAAVVGYLATVVIVKEWYPSTSYALVIPQLLLLAGGGYSALRGPGAAAQFGMGAALSVLVFNVAWLAVAPLGAIIVAMGALPVAGAGAAILNLHLTGERAARRLMLLASAGLCVAFYVVGGLMWHSAGQQFSTGAWIATSLVLIFGPTLGQTILSIVWKGPQDVDSSFGIL